MIQRPGSVFKVEVTMPGDMLCILAGHFLSQTVNNSFSPPFHNRMTLAFTLCVKSRRLGDVFLSRQTRPQSKTEGALPRLQRSLSAQLARKGS